MEAPAPVAAALAARVGLPLALVLLLAATAAAQVPAPVDVSVLNLPTTPQPLTPSSTVALPFEVQFAAEDFACNQPATLHLTVNATSSNPAVTATAAPDKLGYTVPAGLYGIVRTTRCSPSTTRRRPRT